jgi:Fe-S cluster biogenesis protein NfuA
MDNDNTEKVVSRPPVMLYTEQTPNPETLKFVTNRMLYPNKTADFKEAEWAKQWSPLAAFLFDKPYTKSVYISNNFVTLTKEFNYNWDDLMLEVKAQVKNFVENNEVYVLDGFEEAKQELLKQTTTDSNNGEQSEMVAKIINLIDTYVKPAVEMDGGNIEFKSYHDGVVTVVMQGSCSGCPSSSVTLKAGIEGMLQRMIPEIREVVAYPG